MAIRNDNGPLSLGPAKAGDSPPGSISTEFSDTAPHSLTEFYKGGSLVPNTGVNAAVPTTGNPIKFTDFYGAASTSYSITPDFFVYNQPDTAFFDITGGAGSETVYWKIDFNSSTTSPDFDNVVQGSADLGSPAHAPGEGFFGVTITNTDSPANAETFIMKLYSDSARTNQIAASGTITITNYRLTNASSVSEGSSITFNIAGGEPNKSGLRWRVNLVQNVQSPDFTSFQGTVNTLSGTGTGSFNVSIADDLIEETSTELFSVTLYTDNTYSTALVTSSNVTINSSDVPTYSLSESSTSIDEGDTVNFTVNTTNVSNGTTLYWKAVAVSNFQLADISPTSGQGTVQINSNTGSFSIKAIEDATTEGNQQFKVELKTGSYTGTTQATSNNITINDTSLTPEFTLSRSPTGTIYEGDTVTITLSTTYINPGTFNYTITGIQASDLSSGSLQGAFTTTGLYSSASGSLNFTFAYDYSPENNELVTLTLDDYQSISIQFTLTDDISISTNTGLFYDIYAYRSYPRNNGTAPYTGEIYTKAFIEATGSQIVIKQEPEAVNDTFTYTSSTTGGTSGTTLTAITADSVKEPWTYFKAELDAAYSPYLSETGTDQTGYDRNDALLYTSSLTGSIYDITDKYPVNNTASPVPFLRIGYDPSFLENAGTFAPAMAGTYYAYIKWSATRDTGSPFNWIVLGTTKTLVDLDFDTYFLSLGAGAELDRSYSLGVVTFTIKFYSSNNYYDCELGGSGTSTYAGFTSRSWLDSTKSPTNYYIQISKSNLNGWVVGTDPGSGWVQIPVSGDLTWTWTVSGGASADGSFTIKVSDDSSGTNIIDQATFVTQVT